MASGVASTSFWLAAFPNDRGSAAAVVSPLSNALREAAIDGVELHEFAVPSLKIGTLDSLMALSDDLGRADTYCDGVVRKAERQVAEGHYAARRGEERSGPLKFSVRNSNVTDYVKRWSWDTEQFDTLDPLPELVRRIVAQAEKVDADVRTYAAAYNEKKTALTALERKKGGNLMTTALEDIITPAALDAAGAEFAPADSEYLTNLVFVVPKLQEEAFLATYEGLAPAAVPFGPASDREAVRGSPVVPRSARRITEDKEGYALYVVTALKKHIDALRTACREKRFTYRDFTYDPTAAGRNAAAIAALEVEVAATLAHLKEQATRKYSEAVVLWLHLKAVRLFVESILKYGLPTEYGPGRVAFAAVSIHFARSVHRRTLAAISDAWAVMSGGRGLLDAAYGTSEKDKGNDPVIPGISDGSGAAGLPFVLSEMNIHADTASVGRT